MSLGLSRSNITIRNIYIHIYIYNKHLNPKRSHFKSPVLIKGKLSMSLGDGKMAELEATSWALNLGHGAPMGPGHALIQVAMSAQTLRCGKLRWVALCCPFSATSRVFVFQEPAIITAKPADHALQEVLWPVSAYFESFRMRPPPLVGLQSTQGIFRRKLFSQELAGEAQ